MGESLYTRDQARRSLVDTLTFRIASQLATILSYVVLVRGMPIHDFGVYSLFYAVIPVISTALSLGLEQVLERYQPEYLRAGKNNAATWLVRVVATGRFTINLVLLAVLLLGWDYLAPVFKITQYRATFAVFGFLILLHFQVRILQLTLGAHMLHRYSVGSTATLAIVKCIAYGALAWHHQLNLETAVLADIAAYAIAYISMRIAYGRKCLNGVQLQGYTPDPEERRRLVRYGLFSNFNDAGVLLLYSTMDNFFIAAFLDTLSVGIYSFYSRLNLMVVGALPVKLFGNVVQPLFFSIPQSQADQNIPRYFSFLLNMSLVLQWPAFAFALTFHADIVQVIFGGKFVEHSWMLPLFMGFAVMNTISDPVLLVVQYEEKASILLISKLFAAYNLLAMFLLVPLIGIYGAALASGSAQVLKNGFIWWHVRKRARWTNAGRAIAASVVLWGVVVLLCVGLKIALPTPPIVHLAIGAIVFALAALIYIRTPVLSSSDRDLMASIAGNKAHKLLVKLGIVATPGQSSVRFGQ